MSKAPSAICVAGKNRIAIDSLRAVLSEAPPEWRILAVANRTDEGKDGWQPSFQKFAASMPRVELVDLGALYSVEDVLLLSVEFDKLIDPARFDSERLFNIHFSLLPAYKGMYTSCHPILNGETQSGVTLHRIDPGIDTGEIIDQERIEIEDHLRCSALYIRYLNAGIQIIARNLPALIGKVERSAPQPQTGSTYYSKKSVDYENVQIDLKATAFQIQRQINAFHHRAYQLPIVSGEAVSAVRILAQRSCRKAGEILDRTEDRIRLATVDYDCDLVLDRFGDLREAIETDNAERCGTILDLDTSLLGEFSAEGWTPLIIASWLGRAEIVDLLLRKGADANFANPKGTTPLMYAKDAFLRSSDPASLERLLANGADAARRDMYGKKLLDYVELDRRAEVAEIIRSHGWTA